MDFNTLKNRQAQQAYDPEVYDDIDIVSSDNRCQLCETIYSYFTAVSCTFVRMGRSEMGSICSPCKLPLINDKC